jgi:hypothetical protein
MVRMIKTVERVVMCAVQYYNSLVQVASHFDIKLEDFTQTKSDKLIGQTVM